MSDPAADAAAAKEARRLQFQLANPGKLTKAEKDAAKKKNKEPTAADSSASATTDANTAAPPPPATAAAAAGSGGDAAAADAAAAKEARRLQFQLANPGKLTKAEKDAAKKKNSKDGTPDATTTTAAAAAATSDANATAGAAAPAKSSSVSKHQDPTAGGAGATATTAATTTTSAASSPSSSNSKPTAPVPQYAMPESLAILKALSVAPPLAGSSSSALLSSPVSQQQSMMMPPPQQQSTHPRVAALGTFFASRSIVGGNARLLATLDALCIAACSFVEANADGADMRMLQSLSSYLRHNIRFLEKCRPFTAGMKQITDRLMRELGTLELSVRALQNVFNDLRNELTDAVIDTAAGAASLIQNGDIVLTYGRSSAIELALCNQCRSSTAPDAPNFSIIIVDAAPLFEGRVMLAKLREAGCHSISYCTLDAVVMATHRCTKVFIGASALMPSGQVLGRAGTAMVAIAARYSRKPVFCVCESYKFTANMWQGSLTHNQADSSKRSRGSPLGLSTPNTRGGVAGGGGGMAAPYYSRAVSPSLPDTVVGNQQQVMGVGGGGGGTTTLLYDLTPPGSVQFVVSEHEVHEPTAIAAVVRLRQN